jgi:sulfatase maturation enzyme AslB (radical SAM superfamily)
MWRIESIYEHFDENARKSLLNGCPDEFIPERCSECDALNMCHGGCPAENLEESDSPFVMSPNKCDLTVALARAGKYTYDILYSEKNPVFMEHYHSEEPKKQEASAP